MAPFVFDTGTLNELELFAGETITIDLDPPSFMEALETRYQEVVKRRAQLIRANDLRFTAASSQFGHDALDELVARAAEHEVPEDWLDDHPLFGDDAADATLYAHLDELRMTDPLAFVQQLDGLADQHNACAARLHTVVDALLRVAVVRLSELEHPDCVLDIDDDPRHTLARAKAQDHQLQALVANGAREKPDQVVADNANIVVATYTRTRQQLADIHQAVAELETMVGLANEAVERASHALKQLEAAVEGGARIHARIADARGPMVMAQDTLSHARQTMAEALVSQGEGRFVRAHRLAEQCGQQAEQAIQEVQEGRKSLEALDQERRAYLAAVQQLASQRADIKRRLQKVEASNRHLEIYQPRDLNGPTDYLLLQAELARVRSSWNRELRQARRAHEEMLRLKREAEERRRREAARRRAAQSSSVSFGSSGGGFGGSSGGGGSFGGGGSSGGGGGW